MSFVDLATLTLHRRNELEARTNIFLGKCDNAIKDIEKLKVQARNFVQELNCEPSALKDRFLNCMKQLDEYMYLITDFNLSLGKLDAATGIDLTPVHDSSIVSASVLMPHSSPINLLDMLSESNPSTSTACPNLCPTEKPPKKKIAKEDQLLIAFSSNSCSSESVPQNKCGVTSKQVQYDLAVGVKNMTVKDSLTPILDSSNLPAQKVLQVDHQYPATIMSIDEVSFWVITENITEVSDFMTNMTEYYKTHHVDMSPNEIESLIYCAFYDDESDSFYRGLFLKLIEEDLTAEVFLVDTGEVRRTVYTNLQPLKPQFCTKPPYARCCHLAGIDTLSHKSKDLMRKQDTFMNEYVGTQCIIEVDDNTSESLGVYVHLPSGVVLNDILVKEGLALQFDRPKAVPGPPVQGPPEMALEDSEIDITDCPEYEDPVEAVTGYSNRDEAEICKHYKGGPEKTCFKGTKCKKRHVVKHPDGWTLDRVEVPAKLKSLHLPAPGTWHKVMCTCVCHFDRVYVQFVKEKQVEELPSFGVVLPPASLEALVIDMNSPATKMAYKPLTITPAPGELVAALYPCDNQWYRARVLSVTRADQNVEVSYVDYGNVVWVKEDEVRALEPRHVALPAQAVRCVLAGVRPRSSQSSEWAAAKRALARLAEDRRLDAHVVGREYDELIVELFDSDGYSLADQLAAHGLVDMVEYAVVDDSNVKKKVIPA